MARFAKFFVEACWSKFRLHTKGYSKVIKYEFYPHFTLSFSRQNIGESTAVIFGNVYADLGFLANYWRLSVCQSGLVRSDFLLLLRVCKVSF